MIWHGELGEWMVSTKDDVAARLPLNEKTGFLKRPNALTA
jgi:hypothetical protein